MTTISDGVTPNINVKQSRQHRRYIARKETFSNEPDKFEAVTRPFASWAPRLVASRLDNSTHTKLVLMEIEDVTTLLRHHAYEEGLERKELDLPPAEDEKRDLNAPHPQAWERAPQFAWTAREPFSPPTRGYPLPYLDVMTIQSKRLLPVTRKELDAQCQRAFAYKPELCRSDDIEVELPDVEEDPVADKETSLDAEHADTQSVSTSLIRSQAHTNGDEIAPIDFDAILRSVRLLAEPLAIPDLTHTGVNWQLAHESHTREEGPTQFCVTAPNHSFDETQVKLFYPSGAKNANMREYIKETIQKHMAGFVAKSADSSEVVAQRSPTKPTALTGSYSMPVLHSIAGEESPKAAKSPVSAKKKSASKTGHGSPTRLPSSPQKRAGVSSGARLSGAVSTSGLLNPELTRQAKDILAQLRANTNKINDLIR